MSDANKPRDVRQVNIPLNDLPDALLEVWRAKREMDATQTAAWTAEKRYARALQGAGQAGFSEEDVRRVQENPSNPATDIGRTATASTPLSTADLDILDRIPNSRTT